MPTPKNTSQDYDRKHGKGHVRQNPRAAKDIPSWQDEENESDTEGTNSGNASKSAEFLSEKQTNNIQSETKNFPKQDARKLVRQEHTNHFTNRAGNKDN